MRTHLDGSTPAVPAHHAFTPEYLALLAQRDEPVTGAEADASGPWHLEPHPQGWAVLRQGESLEHGSTPVAVFGQRGAARLLAAVLPGTGRRLRYRLGKDPDALGFPVFDDDQLAGHVQHFNEDLLAALNIVDALVSVPRDLAWLLDAAGGLALDHAGKIALEQALIEL
jgi:hypothetical protein